MLKLHKDLPSVTLSSINGNYILDSHSEISGL